MEKTKFLFSSKKFHIRVSWFSSLDLFYIITCLKCRFKIFYVHEMFMFLVPTFFFRFDISEL